MKLSRFRNDPLRPAGSRRGQAAFTMVEIAIAIAVIAFALVAIIGILPSGMQVQRESREQTIINEEARYFLQAIKSGVTNIPDLQEFVDEIVTADDTYNSFRSAREVIGLLSQPGRKVAAVRAVTGSAANRGAVGRDFAFRYALVVDVDPVEPYHPTLGALAVRSNVWDLRLEFAWPYVIRGSSNLLGGERAVYHGLVTARQTNDPPNDPYFFFVP